MTQMVSIAVDTGGTFTDVTLVDRRTGALHKAKTPSTPEDPSIGFINGVRQILAEAGVAPSDVSHVFHGTTVATNTILEMNGAECALLTTTGFRHVLEIGRHDIPRADNVYSWVKPKRPVAPQRIYEIDGRMNFEGQELEPLSEDAVRHAVAEIRRRGIKAIAVCYIHSYANPEHEQRTREIIAEDYPEALISLSSDVLPTFREYERSMVTLLNSYVMPKVSRYVANIEQRIARDDISGRLLLMKSSGGVTGVETIRRQPVHTALSGPAAGVVGASLVGRLTGEAKLISFDVGGTSADIALINGHDPDITMEGSVGDWPLRLPMIDIHTIGAGGGSIARVSNGSLVVGPMSAGALPGPVCYGRGGTEPTVTDAHVVLGHLPPHLLKGSMALDVDAAAKAIEQRVAKPLGLSIQDAASGIIEIANNNMVGAIRVVSVERGHDPADFALVPFGGAGPLHSGFLTRLLGMKGSIVAPEAGVLSSLGLLWSDLKNDFSMTSILRPPSYDLERLTSVFAQLNAEARAWLDAENVPEAGRKIEWSVGMRYIHQGFELNVPWPAHEVSETALRVAIDGFHAAHHQLYTFSQPEMPVEIVLIRVNATGQLAKPRTQTVPAGTATEEARLGAQKVYAAGQWLNCPIYDRTGLGAGATIDGPAILEQLDATTYLLPGQRAVVDVHGNLFIRERV
ncbi:hydantoinase/oxoprolinase family protein [Bosea caraganae]|uniref:Hydantoinase/oxoprolinase family protein n=1 Tax=Bosea caraganae TaxID=2763117 RepID=A0A370KY78_9HYPH|nr:hydantoinase/oxoprolinase family protein [Bosea caraganae]RDJ19930.1 hydantoinase/oxoprolinase family protein [Bosea caraganae]RDJ23868.1 hydantoinase/oxoprolinase family protein [Bosea caraganae]